MSLVKQVNADFVTAFKEKNTIGKMALGNLKFKFSETEKIKKSELSDDEALKVIVSIAKTRNQSIQEFTKAGRMDLVESEKSELEIIEKYLPKQMTEDEIRAVIPNLSEKFSVDNLNINAIRGKVIGEFNKQYQGMADIQLVKNLVQEMIV